MNISTVKKKEFSDRLKGKIYTIEIVNRRHTNNVREPNPHDPYDNGATQTEHSVEGFMVHDRDGFYDLEVLYEPQYDVDYYLLYVVYSSGDSFGSYAGAGIEYIGLYTDLERHIALENKQVIQDSARGDEEGSLILRNPQNQAFKISPPWTGYFESIDAIVIQPIRRVKP